VSGVTNEKEIPCISSEKSPGMEPPFQVSGTVFVESNTLFPDDSRRALYLTVRPDFNRGNAFSQKIPAILSKRIHPIPKTPNFAVESGMSAAGIKFSIDEVNDATENFLQFKTIFCNGPSPRMVSSTLSVPLVISARLDSDGVAATRDADDLVGKTTCTYRTSESKDTSTADGGCENTAIVLTGRGFGGKLITSRH